MKLFLGFDLRFVPRNLLPCTAEQGPLQNTTGHLIFFEVMTPLKLWSLSMSANLIFC